MILPQILSFLFTLGAAYVVGQIFRPSAPAGPRDPGSEQRSRANPRAVLNALYGRWTTFGQEIYLGANADNTRGFYAIALGIIPPNGNITFNRVFADDIQLTLDADGMVVAGSDPNGMAIDKYNGRIRIVRYAGGRSTLLEAQPDWDETFIADRVVYAAVELDRDTAAGLVQLPQLRFTGECDRNNPADAVQDMILDDRFGIAKDISLIGDSFAEHRTYCATEVAHLDRTGTVTVMAERFTVNGEIDCSQSVVDRCNEILAHQNATLGFYGGKYEIFANRELGTIGVLEIDEGWFVDGFEFAENSASLFTQLRVDYGRNQNNQFQPGVLYRDVPTTLQHPSQQSRLDTINLPYCDNFVEASRVSAQYINEAFTGLTIRTTLDIRGIQLKPQQLVRVSSERYSFSQKLFQVKEIDELQEGTVLTYRVLLREYEPSNYTDDGTIQEEDPAPNIDFTEPSVIPNVDDLTLFSRQETSAVPNFTLQWSVPDGFIEEFDVFFSTNVNFTNAVRLRTRVATGGSFTPGDVILEEISGVPTGNYSFWVVGRNQFGSSPESNRVDLDWNPTVSAADLNLATVIRHHENPVTMDPGSPMGENGTDVGWYDPVEGSSLVINRPADPSPHWEATATVQSEGGTNRVVDFTASGQTGRTDVVTPGVAEVGTIEVASTAMTGSGGAIIPARPEQFQLRLTDSDGNTGGSFVGNIKNMLPFTLPAYDAATFLIDIDFEGVTSTRSDGFLTHVARLTTTTGSFTRTSIRRTTNISEATPPSQILSDIAPAFGANLSAQQPSTQPWAGFNITGVTQVTSDDDYITLGQKILRFSVTCIFPTEQTIESLTVTGGGEWSVSGDTSTNEGNTDVLPRLSFNIPELNLTGAYDVIRWDDRNNNLNPNTLFANLFPDDFLTTHLGGATLTQQEVSARANGNISVGFTVDNGTNGDLIPSLVITQQGSDGTQGAFESPMLTINYALDRAPVTSVLALGENLSAANIASMIATAIDGTTTYSASIDGTNDRLINFNSLITGIGRDITVDVTTQGTSALITGNFVTTITTQGTDDTVTGELTSYSIQVGGTQVTDGTFVSNSSAETVTSTLIGALASVPRYVGSNNGATTARATSTFVGSIPDIDIIISGGTDSTLNLVKSIVAAGSSDITDLTGAVWTYYTINQEVRVDDDSVAMMTDNTITIPRGLVVDTENITASATTGTATAARTYLTGNARSNLVITGGVSEVIFFEATTTNRHQHTLEYSTDMGMTWTSFFVTQDFDPSATGTLIGQVFNNVQFIGAQINDIPANTTVAFRGRDTGTAATGSWGFGFLVVEERNVDMTTM